MRHLNARARRAMALSPLSIACIAAAAPPLLAHPVDRAPTGPGVGARAAARHLLYGQRLTLRGRLVGAGAGQPVTVEFRPRHGAWRPLASTNAAPGGSYRVSVGPVANGALRVVGASERARGATAASGGTPGRPDPQIAGGGEQPVAVGARLTPAIPSVDVLGGHRAQIAGALRPARAGRTVALQTRRRGRWRTVARARTGAGGRFRLWFVPHGASSEAVRLRFAGDSGNEAAVTRVGRATAYRPALASWFGAELYGSALACGGTLGPHTLGVAHRTLPCGTRLTLRHGARHVRVRVVDRGPYAGNRELDLTAATRRRLGFGDVGQVWVSR